MNAKSQSALEYLMIIALTLGIIVPTTYIFFQYSIESNTKILDSQISQIGRSMIDTAETVYFSGQNSKIVLQLNMPENVNAISIIDNRELVFNVTTSIGESEAVFFSSINITSSSCRGSICSLAEIAGLGIKKVKFQSYNNGSQVLISQS